MAESLTGSSLDLDQSDIQKDSLKKILKNTINIIEKNKSQI